jgi:hypothetical protein
MKKIKLDTSHLTQNDIEKHVADLADLSRYLEENANIGRRFALDL